MAMSKAKREMSVACTFALIARGIEGKVGNVDLKARKLYFLRDDAKS